MKKVIAFLAAVLMAALFPSCTYLTYDVDQLENGIESVISPRVAGKFVPGTVDGNTYINEYMNIKLRLPKSYEFLTESEMKDVFGVSELYEEGGIVAYDAFARNEDGASVNIVYQLSAVSAEAYIDMITAELSIGNMGGTLELCEKGTLKVGEKELPCVNIEISQENYEGDTVTMYETITVKEKEGWIGVITMGAVKQSDIDTIVSGIEI